MKIPPGMAYYPLLGGVIAPAGHGDMGAQGAIEDIEDPGRRRRATWAEATHGHWRQKDGSEVLISKMTSDHIKNSLRMLWKMANAATMADISSWPDVNEDGPAVEEAGRIADLPPTEFLMESKFSSRAAPLLDEWNERGLAKDSWLTKEVARPHAAR
jgi:hypothetical protein